MAESMAEAALAGQRSGNPLRARVILRGAGAYDVAAHVDRRGPAAPLLAISLYASAAAAGGPQKVRIVGGATACPSPAEVSSALAPLLPEARTTDEPGPGVLDVELSDLGAEYRVIIGGAERVFADPSRSCEDRAHAIAVMLVVALEPPTLATRPPRPPRPTRRLPHVELEVGGILDAAPRTAPDNDLVSGGGALRLVLSGAVVGASLGVGGLSPVTLDLGVVRVRLTRVPFDAALRARVRRRAFELTGELGLALTALVIEGEGPGAIRDSRLDVGLRAALAGRVWIRDRVAPFLGLQLAVFPRPYQLEVEPTGVAGTTPYVWLGGVAGVAVRLH
jgi:hypothetical protein